MSYQKPVAAWLAELTGNLQTITPEDEKNKEDLFKLLRHTVSTDMEFSQTKSPSFTFEKISPLTVSELSPDLQKRITKVVNEADTSSLQKEYRVFQRETPVLSMQVQRSLPLWAGGAAVEKTIGPFINADGRRVWFDFYKVEKLVALYLNGTPDPVIIFNINARRFQTDQQAALLAPATQHYKLTNNSSIWINSKILAPNAPAGKFTGLTIKSGTIDLSAIPVITADKTTISSGTLVTVKLKLKQQKVTDADDSSPYGADSRGAEITLPDILEFEFDASHSKINIISDAKWKLFDQDCSFKWDNKMGVYNGELFSVFIPFIASEENFSINKSLSPFARLSGTAKIIESFWNLPTADLDVSHISPAAGIGALAVLCNKALSATWSGLQNGDINLNVCLVIAHPAGIAIGTTVAGNFYSRQNFTLWKDEKNPHASKVKIEFGKQFPFQFFSTANGYEIIQASVNAIVEVDRPIDVAAKPLPIHTKASVFALIAHQKDRTIILYDNNLIQDNYAPENTENPHEITTIALALRNALFTTTPVNGCFLVGELEKNWKKIVIGNLYLSLGIYKYIPMLPDPYVANISIFKQFKDNRVTDNLSIHYPVMLLLCQSKWGMRGENLPDDVNSSFHLLPFGQSENANQLHAISAASSQPNTVNTEHDIADINMDASALMMSTNNRRVTWNNYIDASFHDDFALLDVSSHANQMGVSFGQFRGQRETSSLFRSFGVETENEQLQSLYSIPFKIEQVQMTSPSFFVRSFALPQIAWEPVHNLTPKQINGDPPKGMNFYPDNGGPTRFLNNSLQYVPLAPKPVIKDIIRRYKEDKNNLTISYFTLPFGLKALALMSQDQQGPKPPSIEGNRPVFSNDLRGGIQIQCNAGKLSSDEFPLFNGATVQLPNVLGSDGNPTGAGTLGESVSVIFNDEFKPKTPLITSRGVPLRRIDFSGYGASIFSNWYNPNAQIAQTSQTRFDVFVGRTAHEVVQVRSLVYPWGIRVVRTIVLYRTNTGYVYRVDTGWQAESDGKFNFTYHIKVNPADENTTPFPSHYKIHPGAIKGLFNIKNIVEINTPAFKTNTAIKNGDHYLDENNNAKKNETGGDIIKPAALQKITFDADIEIEGVVQGHVNGRVPARQVVGYVQLKPMGVPISTNAFTALILHENGSIGGPVNCVVDINSSKQRMRINYFDVSNEKNDTHINDVFVAAGRGNLILPKDGSWSMVTHRASSGEVSPLPENITVPLIRIGQLVAAGDGDVVISGNPKDQLLRIANPTEILRTPELNTINYGFLQNTGTQKALFLTPAFQQGVEQLLSKTPPLFADAYRIMNSKGIFPNIGDGVSNFKDAIPLNMGHFLPGTIQDAGKQVHQLMNIANNVNDAGGQLQEQAYKLMKQVPEFDLPSTPLKLIDEDFLKIYIEYKSSPGNKLNFNINSLAKETEDKWRSRLSNVAMVVDLGTLKRIMTIKGDFNAKKGAESNFGGAEGPSGLPTAKLEFSPALEAVIAILEILQKLSTGDYKEAVKHGLKVAMSNSVGSWDYKFAATKEIPVLRFPLMPLYNEPTVP
ncbi:MAG: hypothetical protein H0V14_11825, partial [Chitinophagaceae bacterium]|nr:hypothetical protein [Chitinophagaceae bacterium]